MLIKLSLKTPVFLVRCTLISPFYQFYIIYILRACGVVMFWACHPRPCTRCRQVQHPSLGNGDGSDSDSDCACIRAQARFVFCSLTLIKTEEQAKCITQCLFSRPSCIVNTCRLFSRRPIRGQVTSHVVYRTM